MMFHLGKIQVALDDNFRSTTALRLESGVHHASFNLDMYRLSVLII
jgi:hypothetical protein